MTQKVHGQKIDIEAVHRTRDFRQENNSENFDFRFFQSVIYLQDDENAIY